MVMKKVKEHLKKGAKTWDRLAKEGKHESKADKKLVKAIGKKGNCRGK